MQNITCQSEIIIASVTIITKANCHLLMSQWNRCNTIVVSKHQPHRDYDRTCRTCFKVCQFISSKRSKILWNSFTLHAAPIHPASFQPACLVCHLRLSSVQTYSGLPLICSVRKVHALPQSRWCASPVACKRCQPCCQSHHHHCCWGLSLHCYLVALLAGLWGLPDNEQPMLQDVMLQ